jgi:uncharacterized membrane protein YraQ (UPF0718 family)
MKKRPSSEIFIGFILLVASGVLLVISPEKVLDAFRDSWPLAVKTFFLTILAVGISVVIHFLVPDDFAERYLSGKELRHLLIYLLYATVLGILTPGPVYAIYPIVLTLKKKGITNPILVSYITGQTIIGPARIPFEVGLFGLDFFLYRLALAVPMGVLAGLLYILFSKVLPDTSQDAQQD